MMQVIEQTRDEKIVMYMKSTKKELAEMLVSCNEAVEAALSRATRAPLPAGIVRGCEIKGCVGMINPLSSRCKLCDTMPADLRPKTIPWPGQGNGL